MKIKMMGLWLQIKVQTHIRHEFECATFLQICLQNASNYTDFSLDFKNFPGDEIWYVLIQP